VLDISEAPGLSAAFPDADSGKNLEALLKAAPEERAKSEIPPKILGKIAPKEGPILSNDLAFKLRASAIDACELIIEQARSFDGPGVKEHEDLTWIRNITLPDLDMWIWSVAKDRSDYRALERFAHKDTVFY
jgi:hypothetical protein